MCITCDVKVKGLNWLKVALYFVKELIIKCVPLICCSRIKDSLSLLIEFPWAFQITMRTCYSIWVPFQCFSPFFLLYGHIRNEDTITFFNAVHVEGLLVSKKTSPSQRLPLTGLVSVLLSGSFVANLEETLRCCERLKVGQLPLPPVDLPCSEGPGTDWWQDSSSADRITNVWGCRRSTPSDESLPRTHGILISQE